MSIKDNTTSNFNRPSNKEMISRIESLKYLNDTFFTFVKVISITMAVIAILGSLISLLSEGGDEVALLFIVGLVVFINGLFVFRILLVYTDMALNMLDFRDSLEELKKELQINRTSHEKPHQKTLENKNSLSKFPNDRLFETKEVNNFDAIEEIKISWLGGTYIGQIKNGIPHGHGKLELPNKTIYNGQWIDGKPNGKGKMIHPDKSVYEGDWENGKKHGKGKYTKANQVFMGLWENGKYIG